jgi:hypothetical protein
MAEPVYLLCAATSLICAFMLLRGYFASRRPLLFWSALCFVGLAVSNVILVADLMILPDLDLSIARTIPALLGLMILVYGLVWEST